MIPRVIANSLTSKHAGRNPYNNPRCNFSGAWADGASANVNCSAECIPMSHKPTIRSGCFRSWAGATLGFGASGKPFAGHSTWRATRRRRPKPRFPAQCEASAWRDNLESVSLCASTVRAFGPGLGRACKGYRKSAVESVTRRAVHIPHK